MGRNSVPFILERRLIMTGSEFVKKIKPFGCAFFLMLFAVFLFICFSSGADPIPGYEPPQDSSYYGQNAETLKELCDELNENVCTKLDGIESCETDGEKVIITIDEKKFASARANILKYYDESLFEFEKG